jgi:FkbM family methyltransferase
MITRFIYPFSLRERVHWKIKRFYPHVKNNDVSVVFDKKLRFDLSKHDVGHQSIIFNGFYELNLTRHVLKYAKRGGVLIDVGANYGYYSCLWASQNSNNKVFAFEASPLNVEPLQNNINKNNLSKAITVIPVAVGKEKGKLSFNLKNEDNQTGWGGLSIDNDLKLVEVEVCTLDEYADQNNIDKIDVLKIDTEGADTWVLYGAKELLKNKRISHIFFEHNTERMKLLNISPNEAKDFLKSIDYVVEQQSPADFYAYPKFIE